MDSSRFPDQSLIRARTQRSVTAVAFSLSSSFRRKTFNTAAMVPISSIEWPSARLFAHAIGVPEKDIRAVSDSSVDGLAELMGWDSSAVHHRIGGPPRRLLRLWPSSKNGVLDEATSSLDLERSQQLRGYVRTKARSGLAFIFSKQSERLQHRPPQSAGARLDATEPPRRA